MAKVCLLLWQFASKELFRERNVHFQSSLEDFSEALQINIERLFLYLWINTSGVFFQYRKEHGSFWRPWWSRKTKTQGIWKHWNFKSPQRKERNHRNSSAISKVKWIIQTYLPLSYLSIDARGALQEQLPGSELTSLTCSKPEWYGLLQLSTKPDELQNWHVSQFLNVLEIPQTYI